MTEQNEQGFAGLVFLDPADLEITESDMSGLNVKMNGETHEGVRASLALPISDRDSYVSLRIGATKGKERELGMIRNLNELDDATRRTVQRDLNKRYFLHEIGKLISVTEKFGFIYFEAETSKGKLKFAMRYEYNQVQEYGEHGRVILDTDENRYIIPDLRELSSSEYKMFTRYIYW